MDFKTFFVKKMLMSFFVSVTCICVLMAVTGMIFYPDTRFGYHGYLWPLMYGAVATLPSLVNYSKKEMSLKQAFIRSIIQLLLIEGIILFLLYSGGALTSASLTISLVIAILIVYLTVHLVMWMNDRRTAAVFNDALKKMQSSLQMNE